MPLLTNFQPAEELNTKAANGENFLRTRMNLAAGEVVAANIAFIFLMYKYRPALRENSDEAEEFFEQMDNLEAYVWKHRGDEDWLPVNGQADGAVWMEYTTESTTTPWSAVNEIYAREKKHLEPGSADRNAKRVPEIFYLLRCAAALYKNQRENGALAMGL